MAGLMTMMIGSGSMAHGRELVLAPVHLFPDKSEVKISCPAAASRRFTLRRPVRVAGVSWRCANIPAAKAIPILWIHGGPFQESTHEEPPPIMQWLMNAGYEIYEPMLHGDEGVGRDMNDDKFVISAALLIDQLSALLNFLQKRHPTAIVFGESLGGYWGSFMAEKLRSSDNLVLFNPIFGTPKQIFIDGAPDGGFTINGKPVPKRDRAFFKKRSDNLIISYFGRFLAKDIASPLHDEPVAKVLIVYGDRDSKIGLQYLPDLRSRISDKVEWMVQHDMEHEFFRSASQYEAFARRFNELAQRNINSK
jgi:pimeloyl-ACP methyl ester carboxylesterase